MTTNSTLRELLVELLDGSEFATAIRQNGKPGRFALPIDRDARRRLVDAHICGLPMRLTFHSAKGTSWTEIVRQVILAAYCPASDGLCRWAGIDLDATDHGNGGLVNPRRAAASVFERAENAGLGSGLLVARSRRGMGRHVFLIPPQPVPLDEAAVAIASLVASAVRAGNRDVLEESVPHAFATDGGHTAIPGQAGALEIIPRSTNAPAFGWALTLPAAAAFAGHDGGVIIDPEKDQPRSLDVMPRCEASAWSSLIDEARNALRLTELLSSRVGPWRRDGDRYPERAVLERLDPRTRSFIDGRVEQGARNDSAFAASANLLGCGLDPSHALGLILDGAARCRLPEDEARSAFDSATRSWSRKARIR